MLIRAKIVLGIKDKSGTSPIYPGGVADVDDNIGMRMVMNGFAEEVTGTMPKSTAVAPPVEDPGELPFDDAPACMPPKTPEYGEVNEESLQEKTYTELKAIAKEMGIEAGKIKSKAGMINAILAYQDTPPMFDAQEVID